MGRKGTNRSLCDGVAFAVVTVWVVGQLHEVIAQRGQATLVQDLGNRSRMEQVLTGFQFSTFIRSQSAIAS
jgi:hypothetical protein